MFKEIEVEGRSRVGFVEKAFPHSYYDLMLLAADDEIRCSFSDLDPAVKQFTLALAADFVDFLSDPDVSRRYGLDGGYLHLAYNYDRYTTDRDNSMCCDKRFHLHLNYWVAKELADLRPIEWGDISDLQLRQNLIDPVAYLSEMIMRDRVMGRALPAGLMTVDADRDQELGLPAGPKIEFPDWSFLRDPSFAEVLVGLHREAECAYAELYEDFIGEPYQPRVWERPRLLPRDRIEANLRARPWLSPDTLEGLLLLSRTLVNIEDLGVPAMAQVDPGSLGKIVLAGLDYAVTLFRPARNTIECPLNRGGPVYLVMHCKMFGTMGGAGLPTIDSVPVVRLDRSRGELFSADQVEQRRRLRAEFLNRHLPRLGKRFDLKSMPTLESTSL
jgi:hypothetical protein